MAKKRERKDYDYYTLSIPHELRYLFAAYITKFQSLGFKNVSQFCQHILQEEASNLLKEYPELETLAKGIRARNKSIILNSGTYFLQEDGSYNKNKD